MASLFETSVSVTVIVPEPFHNPPPSSAVLLVKVEPDIVASALPVICKAPPFPGGPTAVFPSKFESVIVIRSGELTSIAPPARLVVLFVNSEFTTVKVPLEACPKAPPLLEVAFVAVFPSKKLPETIRFVS